jgi:hypothetical protein
MYKTSFSTGRETGLILMDTDSLKGEVIGLCLLLLAGNCDQIVRLYSLINGTQRLACKMFLGRGGKVGEQGCNVHVCELVS